MQENRVDKCQLYLNEGNLNFTPHKCNHVNKNGFLTKRSTIE